MGFIKHILFIILSVSIFSCSSSNKEKIIGSWEAEFKNEIEGIEIPSMGPKEKVVLTFNADMTLKREAMRGEEVMESNSGTYDFEKDQKFLIVYREGMKDRRNVSEIVELTGNILTLVDTSGGGDTLTLTRAR